MIISAVEVTGFRSLEHVPVDLDEMTILLGANSAGKSSLLAALGFFFDDTPLTPDDVCFRTREAPVSVTVTFGELTDSDRAAVGEFIVDDTLTLQRLWQENRSWAVGRARRYPGFATVRAAEGPAPKRTAYSELRNAHPEYGLPAGGTWSAQDQELRKWESAHDDACVEETVDATAILKTDLRTRFRFQHVPAVRDAADDAREGRGSILTQLLPLVAEQRLAANARLGELQAQFETQYEQVVEAMHSPTLTALSATVTRGLQRYLPGAEVQLASLPVAVSVQPPRVTLRGGEQHELTEIGLQGHGFQRTFLIATLEMIANLAAAEEPAFTIFLAIEEPELYQHPARVRQLAKVLDRLAAGQERRVQVCVTTHSPYLIDAQHYERLRLFRRGVPNGPLRTVSRATETDVAGRLQGIVPATEITRRLGRTLDVRFREAFFARTVILTEGSTDVGAILGVAEKMGVDLDALGIVVLGDSGKTTLPVRWAILDALHIPVFVVFDADRSNGNQASTRQENEQLQRILGLTPIVAFPDETVSERHACYREDLEDYLEATIPGFGALCERIGAEHGDWRSKSPETYREAMLTLPDAPPLLAHIVRRATELAQ